MLSIALVQYNVIWLQLHNISTTYKPALVLSSYELSIN